MARLLHAEDSVEIIGGRPVINSRSITPKEKMSDLSEVFPLCAYSGARYLQDVSFIKYMKKL